jgi:hypothetical protein
VTAVTAAVTADAGDSPSLQSNGQNMKRRTSKSTARATLTSDVICVESAALLEAAVTTATATRKAGLEASSSEVRRAAQ